MNNEEILIVAKVDKGIYENLFIFECVLCGLILLLSLGSDVWIGLAFIIFPLLSYYGFRKSKDVRLIVSNKRVTFTGGMFGLERNIPIDSISEVSKSIFKTVRITSSSGIISLSYLDKQQEIYETINSIINDRRSNKTDKYSNSQGALNKKLENFNDKHSVLKSADVKSARSVLTNDNVEQLRNYKTLLDEGIITQEEFEEKKKQFI